MSRVAETREQLLEQLESIRARLDRMELEETRGSDDVTDRLRAEREPQQTRNAIRLIVEGTSRVTGAEFFQSLVRHLSEALGFKYVLLSRVEPVAPIEATTLAFWADGKLHENVQYELAGTPCENVVRQATCLYADHIQQQFPTDSLLVDLEAQSYLGTPLVSSSGQVLGLLAAIDDQPMDDRPDVQEILELFANRAAVEFERAMVEEALHESQIRQALALDAGAIGTWDFDVPNELVRADEGLAKIFGMAPEVAKQGLPLADFLARIHEDDRDNITALIADALTTGRIYRAECRVVGSGRERWIQARGRVEFDASGRAVRGIGAIADITDRKRAEESLRRSEARLRILTDQMPAVLWTTDRELRFTLSTGAGLKELGLETNQTVGVSLYEYMQTDDHTFLPIAQHIRALSGESVTYILPWQDRVFQVYVEPLRDHNDHVIGTIGVGLDITDLKRTEQALVASEARFRALVENSYDVINMFSPEGELLYTSPSIERVLGFRTEEMKELAASEVIHPDDAEKANKEFRRVFAEPGSVGHFTHRLRHKDGSYRNVEVTGTNLLDEPGINAMVSIFRDVTERNQAAEALQRRLEFEALLCKVSSTLIGLPASEIDNAIDSGLGLVADFMNAERAVIILLADDKTKISITHEWCAREIEPIKHRFQDFSVETIPWALEKCLRGEVIDVPRTADLPEEAAAEKEILQSIGTHSFVSIPLIAAGQVWGMVDFDTIRRERDWRVDLLTQRKLVGELFANALVRKRAESELQATQAILAAAIDASPAGIIIADAPDVRIRSVNSAAAGFRGTHLNELTDIPMDLHPTRWRCLHPDGAPYAPEDLPLSRAILEGAVSQNVEVIIQRADGERRWGLANAAPVRDPWGEIVAGVVVFSDVTEKKQAEESLREIESEIAHLNRVSTMGEMVGGLAHELNQPLYAIQNYAKACGNLLADNSDANCDQLREWLDQISSTTLYAGEVLLRLRNFVTRVPMKKTAVEIEQLVATALAITKHDALSKGIRVGHKIPHALPTVNADAVQIQQVLVNLLQNAFDAQQQSRGEPTVEITAASKNDVVEVTVSDNGPGLPSADVKIFEAFNSTKPNGMGLGLTISKTIIEGHGGTLTAANGTDGGAVFRFTLLPRG